MPRSNKSTSVGTSAKIGSSASLRSSSLVTSASCNSTTTLVRSAASMRAMRNASRITKPIKHREYGRIVDLALVGLVPGGHRGNLDMADTRKGGLEPVAEIATYNLGVIKIELNAHVGPPDFANNGGGMLGPG